jgi:hypothetical protein
MKREIIEDACRIYARRYAHRIPEHKGCLFWAAAFNQAARNAGIEAVLQAGTANFQFQKDDGVSPTHFSYEFEVEPAMRRFQEGLLPEMHAWSWIKATNEIVDLTTGFQPQQAKEGCGFDWDPNFRLPRWLWMRVERIRQCHPRVIYRADKVAIMIALAYLVNFHREEKTAKRQRVKTAKQNK